MPLKTMPCPGLPGIFARSDGTIWNARPRNRKCGPPKKMRQLKPSLQSNGYWTVSISLSPIKKTMYVHRLVLEAFRGPCPIGMETRHFPDHNTSNNALRNLSWSTPLRNSLDRRDRGINIPFSILTEREVLRMRKMFDSGVSAKNIWKKFNRVSFSAIEAVLYKRTWRKLL